MLGVEGYGSDTDDDTTYSDLGPSNSRTGLARLASDSSNPSVKPSPIPQPPKSKAGTPSSNSSLSLPLPKSKATSTATNKKTKKILIDLPKLSKGSDDEDELEDERPIAKRPRTGGGASALLSMLPAPTKASSEAQEVKQGRVLGSGSRGGLVFSTSSTVNAVTGQSVGNNNEGNGDEATEAVQEETAMTMLPPSLLLKGKGKGKEKEDTGPVVDFFSLGSSKPSSSRAAHVTTASTPEVSAAPSQISAAPEIEEFRPPSPTPTDPYPGYYQLPSGAWAAYDPIYYKTYYDRWQKEYDAHIRGLEKNAGKERGFEGAFSEETADIHADDQLDEARAMREEQKSLTKKALLENEPKMPKMTVTPSKMSGVARSRHQLGTLLMEAYMNREALEEKIAQGKRNRKEAGNKYGF